MKKFIENKLAENFANKLKDLQKEGLFENVKSFDLDFNGKGINIKLNESAETIFPCEITTYAEESMARSSLDYYYIGDKDDEDWVWSEYVGEDEGGRMVLENSSELRAALNDLINYCEETGSVDLDVDKAVSDLLSTGKAEFIYTSEVNDGEVLKYIIEVQKI